MRGLRLLAASFGLATAALATEPITLVIPFKAGIEAQAHEALKQEYARHTGGRVQVVVKLPTTGSDPFVNAVETAMQGHSGEFDVLPFACTMLPRWAQRGWLRSLNGLLEDPASFSPDTFDLDDFSPRVRAMLSHDGALFGLPQTLSSYLLMYRKDRLAAAGVAPPPPHGWSWSQFLDAARALQAADRKDGVADRYPVVFPAKIDRNTSTFAIQRYWSLGGSAVAADGSISVSGPPYARTVADLAALIRDGLAPPEVVGYAYNELRDALKSGRAAMAFEWDAAVFELVDPARSPLTAGKLGFTVIPYEKDPNEPRVFAQCWALGISAYSRHPREAFEYITWFTSKTTARKYVLTGSGNSGRQSLVNDPEVFAANPSYKALIDSMELIHQTPFDARWSELLQTELPMRLHQSLVDAVPR